MGDAREKEGKLLARLTNVPGLGAVPVGKPKLVGGSYNHSFRPFASCLRRSAPEGANAYFAGQYDFVAHFAAVQFYRQFTGG